MRVQTRETAEAYFARIGATVHHFECVCYPIIRRYEALIERSGMLQVWAWDSSHGGGFWHFISR